jgi:hypothetical protein
MACGHFSEHQLRFRLQKARLLQPALEVRLTRFIADLSQAG